MGRRVLRLRASLLAHHVRVASTRGASAATSSKSPVVAANEADASLFRRDPVDPAERGPGAPSAEARPDGEAHPDGVSA